MKKIHHISLVALLLLIVSLGIFTIVFWFGTPPSVSHRSTASIPVHQWKIAYHTLGQGEEALLLIHSAAWSSVEYTALAERLSKHYTVYLVDLPGYGDSDKPQTSYSLSFFRDTMVRFIEQFPEQRFHLVGSSVGATLSVLLATDFPDRVQSLTMIDPVGFGEEIDRTALIAQMPILAELLLFPNRATFYYVLNQGWLTDHGNINLNLKEQLYQDAVLPKASRAKLSLLRDLITVRNGIAPTVLTTVDQAAIQVQQPVLLLWGEQDSYAPIAQHMHALTVLPQAQYHSIPESGHFPQLEQPDSIAKYIIDFIATTPN